MKDIYVQAVVANLKSGIHPDTVLGNLKTVLERRGHTRLYGEVVVAVANLLEQTEKASSVTVVVSDSSANESAQVKKLIAQLGAENVEKYIVVDPTIIGGTKVIFQSRQLDATHKTALYSLYQSITK